MLSVYAGVGQQIKTWHGVEATVAASDERNYVMYENSVQSSSCARDTQVEGEWWMHCTCTSVTQPDDTAEVDDLMQEYIQRLQENSEHNDSCTEHEACRTVRQEVAAPFWPH